MKRHDDCCDSASTRREFLGRTGSTAAGIAAAAAGLPRVALGARRPLPGGGTSDTLVNIFLRGGMDGLSFCVPYGDAQLYQRRPTLAIQPPGGLNGALDLDGFFGLAPSAGPLRPLFQAGRLAFVHATGSIDPSRSHFDSQRFMELGVPGSQALGLDTGWLGRHLETTPAAGNGLLRGISITNQLPVSLLGAPATLPMQDPAAFTMPGSTATAAQRRLALTHMYQNEAPPLGAAALDTFATIDLLTLINFTGYVPANGAVYPNTAFGTSLKRAAALIKADIDVEVIEIDLGGWDLHNQLGPVNGTMAAKLDELSRGLAAFDTDLAATMGRVTLLAMSEFGRRAGENASAGADHGHGNCLLVLGGHVAGGQVIRQWPGLALANLDQGDLAITIDYRDVVAEILADRMGSTNLATVFPGYTPTFRGVTT
jgi:uncharacterized protein (DUF1501 family)